MKDFYGYARAINLLLTILSVSLISFFIFPSKSNLYERALVDIQFLINTNPQKYKNVIDMSYFRAEIKRVFLQNIHTYSSSIKVDPNFRSSVLVIASYPKSFDDILISDIFKNKKYDTPPSLAYPSIETLTDTFNEMFGRGEYQHGSCISDNEDTDDSIQLIKCAPLSPDDIILRAEFLSEPEQYRSIINTEATSDENRVFLVLYVKKGGEGVGSNTTKVRYASELYSITELYGISSFNSWLNMNYFDNSSIQAANGGTNPLLSFISKQLINYNNYRAIVAQSIQMNIFRNTNITNEERDRRLSEVNKLLIELYTPQERLIGITSIYDEIKKMNIYDAYNYISDKIDKNQQDIDMAGQKINSRFILISAPFFILGLLVALLSATNMIQNTLSSNNDAHGEISFPWFCLHSDTASISISYFTILILPSLNFIASILQPSKDGGIDFTINCILFTLAIPTSLLILRKLRVIRKSIVL
ncbi:hypothetical protein [Enterobacter sp. CC120223-11]|uniref:hypothetical protein n=1 Tax=Enterobacter sp. CC120223-11 TaxID=1378073 RepID=UPI000BDA5838|nr:hypothetical protein [Enterobacter sp. CC120223-11]SNY59849.1 hypothetical protein SAMN02744775_00353 [Enterobacter sp. CC120223-11]